ncbi:hypothetical protein PVAND_016642 [Polypedilum vanderplanki]|uniref:Arginyl-tRNA--protein transferase 1 n=1 Tax=Polypedilum vanderplanki TaxID=319348 RepID=A0A9J6BG70_POLVA|nr:hypothetical protein PVAND_016642 [Polypedilum vanderplanki]
MSSTSIVFYNGLCDDGKCGHCKQTGNRMAYHLYTNKITVEDYQSLLDKNWARSGKAFYLPRNKNNCCTKYQIKCDAVDFKISKSQKKVIKNFNTFLRGQRMTNKEKEIEKIQIFNKKAQKPSKKKFKRVERKKEKILAKGISLENWTRKYQNKEKYLEDLLSEEPTDGKHQFEVKLMRSSAALSRQSFELYLKYQIAVHGMSIDGKTIEGFEKSYIESPVEHRKNDQTPADGYGSFHQQYFIDNRLVAVSIFSILPNCISSCYCFYDPDFKFLNLGTYTALREISFVRELQKSFSNLRFYNFGYFVPTCRKVRYMTNFKPNFLLCPETFTWNLLDENLLKEVEAVKYLKINKNERNCDAVTKDDLNDVMLYWERMRISYGELKKIILKSDENEVLEYAQNVGKKLSQKMLLMRYY